MLAPLRARTHSPLRWDERYVPYLRRAGMLPLARVVCAGPPVMDAPLLTTFVDRWRPETHSFHLPCGEVSITLQDVAMILGLPLEGIAVTGIIQSDGRRSTSSRSKAEQQGSYLANSVLVTPLRVARQSYSIAPLGVARPKGAAMPTSEKCSPYWAWSHNGTTE